MMHSNQQTPPFLLVLIFILFALTACGGALAAPIPPTNAAPPPTNTPIPPTPTPEISEEELAIERGREIFEIGGADKLFAPEYACGHCHSLDGSENTGPTLQGISTVAGERVAGLTGAEYIHQSIMDPAAYITEGFGNKMSKAPSYLLTEDEIDDLIAFLLTQ